MKSHLSSVLSAALPLILLCASIALPQEGAGKAVEEALFLRMEDNRDAAEDVFLPLLQHGDPAVRARACLALGRIGLLECPDWFRPQLETLLSRDDSAEVRAAAALALGEANEGESAPSLLAALEDPSPEVRSAAVDALSKTGSGDSSQAILRLVTEDKSLPVRRSALLKAWRISGADLAAKAIDILRDGPRELHWPAAYFLSRLPRANNGDAHVVPADVLGRLCADADPEIRKCAARIISFKSQQAEPGLLLPLVKDSDRGVRIQALRAAAERGWADLAPAIKDSLTDEDPHLRLEAVTAAAAISAPAELRGPVCALINDPEPAICAAAVDACARLSLNTVRSRLPRLLVDPRALVRAAAVGLADRLDPADRQGVLELGLADEGSLVRIAAAQLMCDDPATSDGSLIRLLSHADPVVRTIAASSFQRPSSPEAVQALIGALESGSGDPSFEAKAEILRALAANSNSPQAVLTLRRALGDPDRNTRILAAALLEDVDGRDYCNRIGKLETGRDIDFYRAALETVRRYPAAAIATPRGTIIIRFAREATLTVNNFIELARQDFFDGIVVHRVVPDFVVQAGCPRGDGWGDAGYSIRCEINGLSYTRGAVGMALAGKDTGGSQWFITLSPQPRLEGGYTIFAYVVSGMEVADRMMRGDTITDVKLLESER